MRSVNTRAPSFRGLRPSSKSSSLAKKRNPGKNTRPELLLRRALRRLGIRYQLHARKLPGKPDVLLPESRITIFCDGDFWHGKHWTQLKRSLRRGANSGYWLSKIKTNMDRDQRQSAQLAAAGWRVLRNWESDIVRDPTGAARWVVEAMNRRGASCARYVPK